jgi:Flp pilus assembly secretin CpaC
LAITIVWSEKPMSATRTAKAAVASLALFALMPLASAVAGTEIEVVMNEAKILKLAQPADTIVVGNPDIADASVKDSQTIVLTGKGFGVTNLVILDVDGQPIVDEKIVVRRSDIKTLRVYRREEVSTLSCTPICEAAFKTEAEATSDTASK